MTDIYSRFLTARRKYIESKFSFLNNMQVEAVLATEGPLLILAGAGSGKTTVLINRIYNLIKYGSASDTDAAPYDITEDMIAELESSGPAADEIAAYAPVKPWQILAITFTNKAAGELKARLERMLGAESNDVWACTFHSACVRILRRDADRLGFTSSFTIYDTSDSLALIKRIIKDFNLDEKYFVPKAILAEISHSKDARIYPEDYLDAAKKSADAHKVRLGEIYSEYMSRLNKADAMDFDDLLLHTVELLDEHEDVRLYWQNRFRYVLIDEYQDTNRLQYLFSTLISGSRCNICVVGDDDQSIYKFRGATIENILSFESQYPGCRTIRLEQNYRSTGHILDAANAVIRNNTERKGKELWTSRDAGSRLELYVADSERDEAAYVSSLILRGKAEGENFRDYCVLYRNNAQSRSIESSLKTHGIPYRIIGGTRFFDRAEIKDILSYMAVVAAPADNLRLERIINVPPRGIGAKSIETATDLARVNGTDLFSVISNADSYPELARPAVRMREFAGLINSLRSFAENNPPDALFDEIIEKTGYIRMLEEKNTLEDSARAENVRELKTAIITYMRDSGDNTLDGYLASVALYTDLDNYDADSDSVTLMTMHASKGLEFPHVIIIGLEETIFPGIRAIGESAEMEEERRLCYVALTRAMLTLNLVAARERMLYGKTSCNRVSRFVEEIPEEHIKRNIPRGFGYSEPSYGSYRTRSASQYGEDYDYIGSSRTVKPPPKPSYTPSLGKKPEVKLPELAVGDGVKHKAFGEGVVVSMRPMGNDYLIEINFSGIGTKKLMLRAAAAFIEKA